MDYLKNRQYAVMSHPMQMTIFIGSWVIQKPVKRPREKKKKAMAQTRFMIWCPFCICLFPFWKKHANLKGSCWDLDGTERI